MKKVSMKEIDKRKHTFSVSFTQKCHDILAYIVRSRDHSNVCTCGSRMFVIPGCIEMPALSKCDTVEICNLLATQENCE